jgi:hypothetical protein
MPKWYYEPNQKEVFRLSRSKVDLFRECPHCFYLDRVLGIKRVEGAGFSLNSAVDCLLKKEFDIHRRNGEAHPLMKEYNIDAIPVNHEELDIWRDNFKGVSFLHPETNLELFGAIDDLWRNSKDEYHVVDYKATSTEKEISLEDEYKQGYKKQAEFYIWLLRQKGYKVSDIAYFVYCNGRKDCQAFDGKLEFNLQIIEYKGDSSWVEPTILEIKKLLDGGKIPEPSENCEWCKYVAKNNGIR